MYLIVGLGNPGKQYENTRHNAGFSVVESVAQKHGVVFSGQKFKGSVAEFFVKGQKVILLKPQTYMNLSGESVIEAVNYYDIPVENIMVISDDLDIEVGRVKIRPKGSSGGQNGLKNIIHHLKTENFIRVKVGIGKNPLFKTSDYVLGKMDPKTAIDTAVMIVDEFISGTKIDMLMNRYNTKDAA